MECIVQYLDDLEDLIYAAALLWERLRRMLSMVFGCALALGLQAIGIYLAMVSPSAAIAFASLLLVALLFGSVMTYRPAKTTATA